jgi:hypothetical protein
VVAFLGAVLLILAFRTRRSAAATPKPEPALAGR